MKKVLIIASIIFLFFSTSQAQVKFGLGAVMGTKGGWELDDSAPPEVGDVTKLIENFGINARVLWDFNEKFDFVGGLTYYFPSSVTTNDLETNYYNLVINADAHYNFIQKPELKVYGLGGLNMSLVSMRLDSKGTTNVGLGIQAGAGIQVWKIYAEGKYDANLEQVVATVGFYF